VVIVDMHADGASGAYSEASDLRCDFCSFAIAMLYLPKPKSRRSRRYGAKHENVRGEVNA
jgi:hypothetical protein